MALSDSIGLIFKIKGDSSQAVKSVEEFKKELAELDKAQKSSLTPFQEWGRQAGLNAEEARKLGAELNGIKVGALAVAAGVTTLVAAATTAGIAMFQLAKSASEFGSEIFDASQKTGLSATALSAMKFAADQSGTSLEQVTAATAKFAKTIGDAANGSDEAKAKLDRLHVTSRNLDEALGQALATIVQVAPGAEEMAAAMDAFGRSGADLLPFIRSFDGNLEALIAKAKELGVTIDDEAARAADEFGDQLDTLNAQLAGVGRTIGQELMPEFLKMAQDIGAFLKENPGTVKAWGETFSYILRRVAAGFLEAKTNADALLDAWEQIKKVAGGSAVEQDYIDRQIKRDLVRQQVANVVAGIDIRGQGNSPNDQPNDLTANLPTPTTPYNYDTKATEEAKKEAEKRAKELLAAQARFNAAQKESVEQAFTELQAITKRNYEDELVSADKFRTDALENERVFANRMIALTNERFDAEAKAATNTKDREAIEVERRNALEKINADTVKRNLAVYDLIEKNEKKSADNRVRIEKQAADQKIAIMRSISETQLAFLERDKDQKILSEREYIKAAGEERLALLRSTLKLTTDQTQRKLIEEQINRQIIANGEAIRQFDEAEKVRHKDAVKRWSDHIQYLQDVEERQARINAENERRAAAYERSKFEAETNDPTQGGILGGIAGAAGVSLQSVFGDQDQLLSEAEFIKNVWTDLNDHIGGAIGNMVQGLAQMAAAWLSTGKFSAKAALQMASSIALSLALQAGVAAIMELARGWAEQAAAAASAAVFDYHGAALHQAAAGMHFAAAAIYGTVAGVAGAVGVGTGLAARAFGGSTASGGGAGGGGASSGGGNRNTDGQGKAYSSYGSDTVIRNAGANAPAFVIRLMDDSQFLGKMLKVEFENNGQGRQVILDAVGQ